MKVVLEDGSTRAIARALRAVEAAVAAARPGPLLKSNSRSGARAADLLGQLGCRPVLIAEARSARMVALLAADRAPALWWATSTSSLRRPGSASGPVAPSPHTPRGPPTRCSSPRRSCGRTTRPAGEAFVCLDDRLREAAGREGFQVLPDVL